MHPSGCHIVITADAPAALTKVCGISLLERWLRILQRLGFREATIVTQTPEAIETHLAIDSWARAEITATVRPQQRAFLTPRDLTGFGNKLLLVRGDSYCDPRLLSALMANEDTTVLADSGGGAALVTSEWIAAAHPDKPLREQMTAVRRLELNAVSSYVADLRREVRPIWFAAPAPEDLPRVESLLLDAAQNGTLDLPAKVHAPIETWIIRRLCKTNITPNQITLSTACVSAIVTVLFAAGELTAGMILALAVGVLDGLDGKQARVKVETTKLGQREHVLDYVLELSWWTALAFHFTTTGQVAGAFALLLLLVGSDILDRIAKRFAKQRIRRNLDDFAPIDRFVRLIGGRRNVYVWIFALGLATGVADKAFVALCWWGALTAAVHVLRAGWISRQRGRP